jgi:hypothetical protein
MIGVDTTKTQIYRGGLAGLLGKTGASTARPVGSPPPTAAASARETRLNILHRSGADSRLASIRPAWPGVWRQPPRRLEASRQQRVVSDLGSTPIVPIEGLLSPQSVALPSQAQLASAASSPHSTSRGMRPVALEFNALDTTLLAARPTHPIGHADPDKVATPATYFARPVGYVALVGAFTVAAVAIWKLPLERELAPRLENPVVAAPHMPQAGTSVTSRSETKPSSPVEPRESTAGIARATVELADSPAAAAHAPELTARLRIGTERSAINAVLSGDYANAQRLYRELARANPELPVFMEAARIVAAREQP